VWYQWGYYLLLSRLMHSTTGDNAIHNGLSTQDAPLRMQALVSAIFINKLH